LAQTHTNEGVHHVKFEWNTSDADALGSDSKAQVRTDLWGRRGWSRGLVRMKQSNPMCKHTHTHTHTRTHTHVCTTTLSI